MPKHHADLQVPYGELGCDTKLRAGGSPLYSCRGRLPQVRAGRRGGVADQRVERKLSAILAVDVASYSRLMGADEEGTLARLKAHRHDLVDPRIEEHRGRIV